MAGSPGRWAGGLGSGRGGLQRVGPDPGNSAVYLYFHCRLPAAAHAFRGQTGGARSRAPSGRRPARAIRPPHGRQKLLRHPSDDGAGSRPVRAGSQFGTAPSADRRTSGVLERSQGYHHGGSQRSRMAAQRGGSRVATVRGEVTESAPCQPRRGTGAPARGYGFAAVGRPGDVVARAWPHAGLAIEGGRGRRTLEGVMLNNIRPTPSCNRVRSSRSGRTRRFGRTNLGRRVRRSEAESVLWRTWLRSSSRPPGPAGQPYRRSCWWTASDQVISILLTRADLGRGRPPIAVGTGVYFETVPGGLGLGRLRARQATVTSRGGVPTSPDGPTADPSTPGPTQRGPGGRFSHRSWGAHDRCAAEHRFWGLGRGRRLPFLFWPGCRRRVLRVLFGAQALMISTGGPSGRHRRTCNGCGRVGAALPRLVPVPLGGPLQIRRKRRHRDGPRAPRMRPRTGGRCRRTRAPRPSTGRAPYARGGATGPTAVDLLGWSLHRSSPSGLPGHLSMLCMLPAQARAGSTLRGEPAAPILPSMPRTAPAGHHTPPTDSACAAPAGLASSWPSTQVDPGPVPGRRPDRPLTDVRVRQVDVLADDRAVTV